MTKYGDIHKLALLAYGSSCKSYEIYKKKKKLYTLITPNSWHVTLARVVS